MNSAHASHDDSPAAGVASWYTPGRSDGFGDRLLMSDNTDAISLELLRFRRDVAGSPGFEHALVIADGAVVAAGPLDAVLGGGALARAFGLPIVVERRDGRTWARLG